MIDAPFWMPEDDALAGAGEGARRLEEQRRALDRQPELVLVQLRVDLVLLEVRLVVDRRPTILPGWRPAARVPPTAADGASPTISPMRWRTISGLRSARLCLSGCSGSSEEHHRGGDARTWHSSTPPSRPQPAVVDLQRRTPVS